MWLEEKYVATFVVLADALDAFACHHDAALAVGEGEEFVAGAVEDEVGALVGHQTGAVAQEDDGLSFALGGETGHFEDGDEAFLGAEEAYLAVGHDAVVPVFTDGEDAILVVFVVAMFESIGVEAFAGQTAVVIVFDEASLKTTVDISAGDVAFFADAAPPAAVTVVVGPGGDFGGVAVVLKDDMTSVFDAHIVGSFLQEAAVFGIELPEAVAVALVVFSAGEEVALLVVSLMQATFAGFAVGVADADGAVVVIVSEDAGLEAVLEIALENLGAVLVGTDPMTLTAALLVDLVLGNGTGGGEHHGRDEEENTFFHGLQWIYYIIVSNYNVLCD